MQVTPKLVSRQWAYSYLAVGVGLSCNDITHKVLSVEGLRPPASSTSKLHFNLASVSHVAAWQRQYYL